MVAGVVERVRRAFVTGEEHEPLSDLKSAQLSWCQIGRTYIDPLGHVGNRVAE
jgi:hypothetical protein